jgi:hypothetical protein
MELRVTFRRPPSWTDHLAFQPPCGVAGAPLSPASGGYAWHPCRDMQGTATADVRSYEAPTPFLALLPLASGHPIACAPLTSYRAVKWPQTRPTRVGSPEMVSLKE